MTASQIGLVSVTYRGEGHRLPTNGDFDDVEVVSHREIGRVPGDKH
jgi:hypothetical protein